MSVVAFRRVRGRIIPILKKAGADLKNIPSSFQKGPKILNQRKGQALMSKIEGKISGAKSFQNDFGSGLNNAHRSALRAEISRNRDRWFKVKNTLEDNQTSLRKFSAKRASGIRGLKIVGVGTISAAGLSAFLKVKKSDGK